MLCSSSSQHASRRLLHNHSTALLHARRRYLRWLQLFTSCLSLAIQLLEQQQAKEAGRKQASRTAVLPGTGTAAVVPPPEAVRPLVEEGWCAPLGVEHLPQLKAQLTVRGTVRVSNLTIDTARMVVITAAYEGWLDAAGGSLWCSMCAVGHRLVHALFAVVGCGVAQPLPMLVAPAAGQAQLIMQGKAPTQ